MRLKKVFLGVSLLLILAGGYMYFAHFRPIPPHELTGEYAIGTTDFDFEFSVEGTVTPRKLAVRIWYPSDATEGTLAFVSSQKLVDKMVAFYQMPDFMATTEASRSYIDAAIAEGPFPVLVFNHGFGAFSEQNTINMQELASNGYIVLSISHPETSLLTEYASGADIAYNPDLPAFLEQSDLEQATANSLSVISSAVAVAQVADGFEAYWQGMRTLAQSNPFANMQPILRDWIADSNALINAIAEGKTSQLPPLIAAQMEASNTGIFGHSLGGMAAIAASMSNENIKAVVNLDGPFAFDAPTGDIALPVPTCMLMADGFAAGGEIINTSDINTPLFERAAQGGCVAVFSDTLHMNFTDLNYISFLRLFNVLGAADQQKFGVELNHLLVSFFDRHLKGDEAPYAPVNSATVTYSEF